MKPNNVTTALGRFLAALVSLHKPMQDNPTTWEYPRAVLHSLNDLHMGHFGSLKVQAKGGHDQKGMAIPLNKTIRRRNALDPSSTLQRAHHYFVGKCTIN